MCKKCDKYEEALKKIASPFSFSSPLDPQTDAIIAYLSLKVGIAVEALSGDSEKNG